MKTTFKVLLIIISILITIATAFFQYIPASQGEIDGVCPDNIKGKCLPVAGFPISYAKDSESHSVVGSLEFIGDDLYPHWFVLDIIFYYFILWLVLGRVLKLGKASEKGGEA